MSSIIPILSSTPPPLDDAPPLNNPWEHDDDDDVDDFGAFTETNTFVSSNVSNVNKLNGANNHHDYGNSETMFPEDNSVTDDDFADFAQFDAGQPETPGLDKPSSLSFSDKFSSINESFENDSGVVFNSTGANNNDSQCSGLKHDSTTDSGMCSTDISPGLRSEEITVFDNSNTGSDAQIDAFPETQMSTDQDGHDHTSNATDSNHSDSEFADFDCHSNDSTNHRNQDNNVADVCCDNANDDAASHHNSDVDNCDIQPKSDSEIHPHDYPNDHEHSSTESALTKTDSEATMTEHSSNPSQESSVVDTEPHDGCDTGHRTDILNTENTTQSTPLTAPHSLDVTDSPRDSSPAPSGDEADSLPSSNPSSLPSSDPADDVEDAAESDAKRYDIDENLTFRTSESNDFEEPYDDFAAFPEASESQPDDDWAAFGDSEQTAGAETTWGTGMVVSEGPHDDGDNDDFGDFSDFKSNKPTLPKHEEVVAPVTGIPPAGVFSTRVWTVISACFPPGSHIDINSPDVQLLDLLIQQLTNARNEAKEGKESKTDGKKGSPPERKCVWYSLAELEKTIALTYQFCDSLCNNTMLQTLKVDKRNILMLGNKKMPVPLFAANLGSGMLEPTRGPVQAKPEQKPHDSLVDTGKPESNGIVVKETLPPVEFDWRNSGLINPLELSSSKFLNLDALSSMECKSGSESPGKGVFRPSTLPDADSPVSGNKTLQPLEQILHLADMKHNTTLKPQKRDDILSNEAIKIISTLPDLSFMQAKVLMFPLKH